MQPVPVFWAKLKLNIKSATETISDLLRLFFQIQEMTGNPVFLSFSEKNTEIMFENIGENLITTCSGKKKCANHPNKYNVFILFCSIF